MARIFTAGAGNGGSTRWGQLGLAGAWTDRTIHLYGPRDNRGFASAIRDEKMGGFPFTGSYEPLSTNTEIIRARITSICM